MFNKYNIFNRPISPHLTIYVPFGSSVFSIWHRFTAILLTIFLFLIIISLKFNYLFNIFSNLVLLIEYWYLIFCFIFIINILFYHFLSGIRHIIWDLDIILTNYKIKSSNYFLILSIFLLLFINLWKL